REFRRVLFRSLERARHERRSRWSLRRSCRARSSEMDAFYSIGHRALSETRDRGCIFSRAMRRIAAVEGVLRAKRAGHRGVRPAFHDISARKPLTSVRGGIALQSCPSRVSLSTHGGTAEYRGIVGASRPVVEVRHGTLTRSARYNKRCSPTRTTGGP